MTENKGDLISREALKKAIIEHRVDYVEDNFFWSKLFNIIDNATTVSERPQGKWIRTALYGETCYECNKCNRHQEHITNYCPSCGAYMIDEETEYRQKWGILA